MRSQNALTNPVYIKPSIGFFEVQIPIEYLGTQ